VVRGWDIQARTAEAAKLALEREMDRRGYWGLLREWIKGGRKVAPVGDVPVTGQLWSPPTNEDR